VNLADIFASLRGIPRLPGALCREQHQLFDLTAAGGRDDEIAAARQLCERCPALDRCAAWADTLGDNDVNGVVAGRLFVWVSHPSLRRAVEGR
jgi:hypothetical protein